MGSVSSMGSIILAHVTEWWLLVVGPLTIVVICCRLSLANSLVQGWLHEGFVKHGCICTFRTLDVFLSPIPLFHQIEAFCIFIFWNSIRIYTCLLGSCIYRLSWASWRRQVWICIILSLSGQETYQVIKSVTDEGITCFDVANCPALNIIVNWTFSIFWFMFLW